MTQWETRKLELDHFSQFRLFEQDAENLSAWIRNQLVQISNNMTYLGETETETSRLLKDHLELTESINVSRNIEALIKSKDLENRS